MIIHDVLQRSAEWYKLRAGIPTASNFDKILTPKTLKPAKSNYHFSLAVEQIVGGEVDRWLGNIHTDHGVEAEQEAVEAYEAITGRKLEHIGFVTDDKGRAGCSPDAVVVGEKRGVEFKAYQGAKTVETFCNYIETGIPALERLQIQGSLLITEFEAWDFVLFHPELEPKIITLEPCLDIHKKLNVEIDNVIKRRDEAVKIWQEN